MVDDGVLIGRDNVFTILPPAVAGIPYPEPAPQAEPEQITLFGNT